ncbi:MAG: lytic transglycosylase domain-containing protein [Angelakisella sp.]
MIAKSRIKAILLTLLIAIGTVMLYISYRTFFRAAYPIKYAETVGQASTLTGVEESLLYAVIRTESGFREDVQSSVGACGLMQITPDTLSWVRYRMGETGEAPHELLFEPKANIYYGAHTLELLIQEFGQVDTALAAYHAGWGNVTRWLTDSRYSADGTRLHSIPFADTNSYVTKVLYTARMYETVYDLS